MITNYSFNMHKLGIQSYDICLLIIAISLFITSCKKIVDVDLPIDSIPTEAVFSNEEGATAAVLGIYSKMAHGDRFEMSFATGSLTILPGMSSDELKPVSQEDQWLQFLQNDILKTNDNCSNIWQKAYTYLYQVNACIEGLQGATNVSSKNQLLGECKFLRAFILFYLTNLYGDIAMPITSDWRQNSIISRTSDLKVYEQIISDLKEAEELLSENYPDPERIRVNKYSATSLLSRAYLYTGDWQNAESAATRVINSGIYSLEPDLSKVFLKNSPETIFEIKPDIDGPRTATLGFIFFDDISASFYLTDELLNSIELGDARKDSWIRRRTSRGRAYMIPNKYKVDFVPIGGLTEEFNVVLRLGEQYLIRSEARVNQNKLEDAIDDLNIIRTRANLASLPSSLNQTEVISAVEKERRIELMAEWGHRWFDLKRTGKADNELAPLKTGWQTTDKVYPIPESEILMNPNLTQNPGYN